MITPFVILGGHVLTPFVPSGPRGVKVCGDYTLDNGGGIGAGTTAWQHRGNGAIVDGIISVNFERAG